MKPFILVLFLFPLIANAFPEFVRHGYTNCATCHASPTGGGLLNEYGRSLSKELLSHGSFFWESSVPSPAPGTPEDHSEAPLYGTVNLPKGISLGGDARAVQLIEDNPKETKGQFVFMQADLEAAYSDGHRLTLDGTIGRGTPDKNNRGLRDWLVSHRHWLSLKLGPDDATDEFQLRFGRFYYAYGIAIPDHTSVTRSQLGFDHDQETYNTELSYVTENWNVFATYDLGRPDNLDRSQEKGGALQITRAIGNTTKVGANAFFGHDPNRAGHQDRRMYGVFGMLGFSPQWYSLLDASLTYDSLNRTGLAELVRLGWEFSQGVHLIAEQQTGKPSLSAPRIYTESYTLGLDYFPRVHWEFDLSAGEERTTSVSRNFSTVWLLLAHYYL
jgi:hypothetical protein